MIMKGLRNVWSLRCGRSDGIPEALQKPPQPFCLPSPLSDWPSGTGFARGHLDIGELVVAEVTNFEEVWSTNKGGPCKKGASFYKPISIPTGYHCLGYYCQANTGTLDGWVLVAKESEKFLPKTSSNETCANEHESRRAPLSSPTDYRLVWSTSNKKFNRAGFFWLPCAPNGYVPMGFVVTKTGDKPATSEVMCVRIDLTDACKVTDIVWSCESTKMPFIVQNVYPCKTGLDERGIVVGTFSCNSVVGVNSNVSIACLKNTASVYDAMPNTDQIDALMSNYGPVFYFHPNETYFPSSVTWFFEQGALLYKKNAEKAEKLACDGCNLPVDSPDGEYWIGLPDGDIAETIKRGNLASAKGYVQVKPMLGGTFTDLVIWIYYPFNGPSTAKLGVVDVSLGKIGEHVSDWEHVTLRISNVSGTLRRVYFAQHSGGLWVNASEVEYAHDNNIAVFSSWNGHASYPHPGLVLQGDRRVGVGIRNDTARSAHVLETAKNYEVVSAKHLRSDTAPNEPTWLHYTCEWGPKIQYDQRAELDKVLERLPQRLKKVLESFLRKFPHELSGEQGPTGPRQKNYWLGDERVKHH